MSDGLHIVSLTEYEYEVLKNNSMISQLCKKQLKSRRKNGDEIELSMTMGELEDLIGHVAAEANHTRSKRQAEDLGGICDYLETCSFNLRMRP